MHFLILPYPSETQPQIVNFNHHSIANRRIEDQAKARRGKKIEFGISGTEGRYAMYVFLHRLFNLRGQRDARVVASFEDADRQKLRLGGLGLQQQVCQHQPSRPGSHNHRPSCTRLRHCLLLLKKQLLLRHRNLNLHKTQIRQIPKFLSATSPPPIDRPALSQITDSSPPKTTFFPKAKPACSYAP
jgi:hypothetical protein